MCFFAQQAELIVQPVTNSQCESFLTCSKVSQITTAAHRGDLDIPLPNPSPTFSLDISPRTFLLYGTICSSPKLPPTIPHVYFSNSLHTASWAMGCSVFIVQFYIFWRCFASYCESATGWYGSWSHCVQLLVTVLLNISNCRVLRYILFNFHLGDSS